MEEYEMKKNYILSYKIWPYILTGYSFIEAVVYLYSRFVMDGKGGTGPIGTYMALALLSMLALPVLAIGAHTTYLELKRNEPKKSWPPLWKHIVLMIAICVIGCASFVLGIYMFMQL
jgi:hypothetical protein